MSCSRLLTAIALFALVYTLPVSADEAKVPTEDTKTKVPKALDFEMKSLDGKKVELSKYQGKVVLMVNVASQCGLTPQYRQLQALHDKYADKGLAILGFPCNQFGRQEPGTSKEIATFCTSNYGVKFDMFEKVAVNGDEACPLYKHLTSLKLKPKGDGKVSWNFEKFLLDRNGAEVARFQPRTAPNDESVVKLIEKLLAEKPKKS